MAQREIIENNIIIRLTNIGIALLCDYYICDRCDNNFEKAEPNINIETLQSLKHGNKLFLNGSNLQMFNIDHTLTQILTDKNIKLYFYIGVIEPNLQSHIIDSLLPYAIKIYVTNNIHPNPKCRILPIGIRDGEEVFNCHRHFTGKDIINEMQKICDIRDKKYLALMCFTNETHITRYDCENTLKEKPFIMNLNNKTELMWSNKGGSLNCDKPQSEHCGLIPQWIFYEYCHKSVYTLCPRGVGEDTHRFFEALALNSIPIVKKTNTPFDMTFEIFPCLVINDWNEVSENLLLENKERLIEQIELFHIKYPNFLTNKQSILRLLDDI
jgi:hypothetical protein